MSRNTKEFKSRYRARVLEVRLQAGIAKQRELAERTGIPATIMSDLESGKLFLSSAYALRIKEVLGCSLDDLFELRSKNALRR